jgi:hypothetical protein
MRWMVLGLVGSFLVAACGPSMKADRPKSAEEIVKDEELAAYKAEQNPRGGYVGDDEELDSDNKSSWDDKQATLELKRAARSASTCHGSIPEEKQKEQPKGEAEVTLVFSTHGTVKSVSISSPFDGTDVGKCALRAMKSVIVPPFTDEPEHSVTWKVDLTGKPKEE